MDKKQSIDNGDGAVVTLPQAMTPMETFYRERIEQLRQTITELEGDKLILKSDKATLTGLLNAESRRAAQYRAMAEGRVAPTFREADDSADDFRAALVDNMIELARKTNAIDESDMTEVRLCLHSAAELLVPDDEVVEDDEDSEDDAPAFDGPPTVGALLDMTGHSRQGD